MTWTEAKNDRRCDLIDKKYDTGINDAEADELAILQSELDAERRRVAPLPIEELERYRSEASE